MTSTPFKDLVDREISKARSEGLSPSYIILSEDFITKLQKDLATDGHLIHVSSLSCFRYNGLQIILVKQMFTFEFGY